MSLAALDTLLAVGLILAVGLFAGAAGGYAVGRVHERQDWRSAVQDEINERQSTP